jgi:O-antigen ligase
VRRRLWAGPGGSRLIQGHPTAADLDGPWRWGQGGLLILPLVPAIAALLWFGAMAVTTRRRWPMMGRDRLVQGFSLLGLWMALTTIWATDRGAALLGLANFLPYFWAFGAISQLITHPAQLRQMGRLIYWSALPVAILGLGQMGGLWAGPVQVPGLLDWPLAAGGLPLGRLSSSFGYANGAACYLAIALCLGLGEGAILLRQGRGRSRLGLLTLAAAVPVAIALAWTHSRMGWGVLLGAMLTYGLLLGWRSLVGAILAMVGLVTGAAFGPGAIAEPLRRIVPELIWGRLNDSLYPDRPIATLRWFQWHFSGRLIALKPITGWGLRSFEGIYQQQTGIWLGHPHNLPLMVAAETGLPGAIALVALVGLILGHTARWLIQNRPSERNPKGALSTKTDPGDAARGDRAAAVPWLSLFSITIAFGATVAFHSADVLLFDWRINLVGWLLLAGLWGNLTNAMAFTPRSRDRP